MEAPTARLSHMPQTEVVNIIRICMIHQGHRLAMESADAVRCRYTDLLIYRPVCSVCFWVPGRPAKVQCISPTDLYSVSHPQICTVYLTHRSAQCISPTDLHSVSHPQICTVYLTHRSVQCISPTDLHSVSHPQICTVYLTHRSAETSCPVATLRHIS